VAGDDEGRSGELGRNGLEVGLGAGDERDARTAVRERVREQPAEPAAGAGDDDALVGHVVPSGEGAGDLDFVAHRTCPAPGLPGVCTDHYNARLVTDGPCPPPPFPTSDLLELYRRMLLVRGFEERVAALYRDGEVPGFVHLSIGQEATAVGACWPLGTADVVT